MSFQNCLTFCKINQKLLFKFKKLLFNPCCKKHYDNRNILKLHERGMFEDVFPGNSSNEIKNLLSSKSQCVYAGFDPTASSLHIGNLLILKNLLHWQRAGHQVIILIGTATAQIGDPSDRKTDREQQIAEVVREQGYQIKKNIQTIFENHENYFWNNKKDDSPLLPIIFVNNEEWYKNINIINFMNKIGRHFRMGPMLLKDSVNKRLQSECGMCFTEFTYQIFQAYDWYYLYKEYDCKFQVGGKDQMGNITAGYQLINRMLDKSVYGFTLPLIVSDAGDKFGKSLPNAVWLDPLLTSPFDLYQFYIRIPDNNVENSLNLFTFLHLNDIKLIMEKHKENPEKRIPQNKLAEQVTLLVHGEKGLEAAKRATDAIYNSNIEMWSKLSFDDLHKVIQGATIVDLKFKPGYTILEFVLDVRCFFSKADAYRITEAGGLYINLQKARNLNEILSQSVHVLPNNTTIVRIGKKNYWIVRWTMESF